jgi:hypothetical protein
MASIDLNAVAAVDSAGVMTINSARVEVVSLDAEMAADSDGDSD